MVFKNEDTFQTFLDRNEENQFHNLYEKAVNLVSSQFGRTYLVIINGKKVSTSQIMIRTSPADRRIILGYMQKGNSTHAKKAIHAAMEAFEEWSTIDYKKRVKLFRKIGTILKKRKFELSAWLTFENGKNRYESIADIDEAIDFVMYYSDEMEKNNGFVTKKSESSNELNTNIMKPYGVWAIIAPFNFPAAILVGMSAGALITGNTVIVKPASDTPIIGYKIVEIMIEAGIPNGVINFVPGSGVEIGKTIIDSNEIAGVVFTGSREVGYRLMSESKKTKPRPVIAELGGKNATIVTDTANLDMAAEGIAKAAFSYSGQKCSACSRVYVQRNVKSQFLSKLLEKTKKLKVENPKEKESYVGPLINLDAYNNFKKYSRLASKYGNILTGGSVIRNKQFKHGFYVEPTIVDGLPKDHPLLKKELFVPILCVTEYDKFDNAIKMTNESEYGLTSGIYSNKKDEIFKFLQGIEAGVIYVNRKKSSTTGAMVGRQSFGGWKDSGTTGKGTGGRYYLTQFMREQSQTIVK
ncbi:MAG: aldehyde dehydrogenase family protein [Thaumarchaeota archaeon]|nr:MAG: aldehyde dehydrogenase family protein [Nitrososphaerota archaeon]TLX90814.1 MAG: aldehyde dehydrogenase family protein [Nitrososphaerota archaeon]